VQQTYNIKKTKKKLKDTVMEYGMHHLASEWGRPQAVAMTKTESDSVNFH
jgi:hypothetical protein